MFKRTKICTGLLVAFGSSILALPAAHAQDADSGKVQRVEITGSSIKRIDAETSEPVTVVKMEDLKKEGVTSVEQILAQVTAAQTQQATAQVVGLSTGGASFADLRGIGANKTLVLLNGRRISNNAFDSSAPDLNMIPFAAIERVEVLRDGASSLYGTDAIGGVINFITRKDYQGGTISLGVDMPQHAGGGTHSANLGLGLGDLDKQGINVLGFVDFSKTAAIQADQRPYSHRTISGASQTTYPGTYFYDNGANAVTPFAAPTCAASQHLFSFSDTQCGEVTGDFVNLTPESERISGLAKATVKLNENHQASLEVFASHDKVSSQIAPVPYTGITLTKYLADGSLSPYFPGNGITPLPDGVTDVGDSVTVRFRDLVNGYREDVNTNTQYRVTGTLEGTVGAWDYDAAVSLNHNHVQEYLAHGYADSTIITQGIEDGIINPFGDQTAAGLALLQSAQQNGVVQYASGQVQQADAHASREIGDWFKAGRAAALAVGVEARHETFVSQANPGYAAVVEVSSGIDPNTFNAGSRNVYAGFFELNVPIVKSLDVTLAGRYDKYSDFGSTFNPKASFRFQPSKQFLVRGSFSTGFRAPSLYELNGAQTWGITSSTNDPEWCVNGVAAAGHPTACSGQFSEIAGGNPDLKPERAKNATLGIVLEPINNLTLEADLWNIQLKDEISTLSATTILSDESLYANYIHRNANGDLSTDSTQCPGSDCGYLSALDQNLGGVHTNGIDFVGGYRADAGRYGRVNFSLASTWVHEYNYQSVAGGEWTKNVGTYAGSGPVFRWQHNLGIDWTLAPFSVGVAAHYKSGYIDEYVDTNDAGDVTHTKVSAYATFDLHGTYAMEKGFALTLGVKNLFDRDPPYSNQTDVFQGGYDPRYTDPTGRTFYARGSYSF